MPIDIFFLHSDWLQQRATFYDILTMVQKCYFLLKTIILPFLNVVSSIKKNQLREKISVFFQIVLTVCQPCLNKI